MSSRYLSPFSARKQNTQGNSQLIQQQQIQDLQQKVDIILLHNEQLIAENTHLIKEITLREEELQQILTSNAKLTDINKINSSQISSLQIQQETRVKELISLKNIIQDLTDANQRSKLEYYELNKQLQSQQARWQRDLLDQKNAQKRFLEEQLHSKSNQTQQALKEAKEEEEKRVRELKEQFEREKEEMNNRKASLISRLQEKHDQQISELSKEYGAQFEREMHSLEEEAAERCRNERDKAEEHIKNSLNAVAAENNYLEESFLGQINSLKQALESKQRALEQITRAKMESHNEHNWYEEVLNLQTKMKEIVNKYLKENQILKIRSAQAQSLAVKEVSQAYLDRIEVLSVNIMYLREQNQRLHNNYEEQIRSKLKQKKFFELQGSKLKNLIRKLRVDLQGLQQEFRLNIDGLRDQNNTFSMSLLKSTVQEKDKANFFEDENRKLRTMYERNQAEIETIRIQAKQKIGYYEKKREHYKNTLEDERNELRLKSAELEKQLLIKQQLLKEGLSKEREDLQCQFGSIKDSRDKVEKENFNLLLKCSSFQSEIAQNKNTIGMLDEEIKDNRAHIEHLKMELEMAGGDKSEANGSIEQWKAHFQRIIAEMKTEIALLQETNALKNENLSHMVIKYNLLENSLAKTISTLKKRETMDKRVLEIGLDQNLIKNMAQLFATPK